MPEDGLRPLTERWGQEMGRWMSSQGQTLSPASSRGPIGAGGRGDLGLGAGGRHPGWEARGAVGIRGKQVGAEVPAGTCFRGSSTPGGGVGCLRQRDLTWAGSTEAPVLGCWGHLTGITMTLFLFLSALTVVTHTSDSPGRYQASNLFSSPPSWVFRELLGKGGGGFALGP